MFLGDPPYNCERYHETADYDNGEDAAGGIWIAIPSEIVHVQYPRDQKRWELLHYESQG
jgi:hypothetical protein